MNDLQNLEKGIQDNLKLIQMQRLDDQEQENIKLIELNKNLRQKFNFLLIQHQESKEQIKDLRKSEQQSPNQLNQIKQLEMQIQGLSQQNLSANLHIQDLTNQLENSPKQHLQEIKKLNMQIKALKDNELKYKSIIQSKQDEERLQNERQTFTNNIMDLTMKLNGYMNECDELKSIQKTQLTQLQNLTQKYNICKQECGSLKSRLLIFDALQEQDSVVSKTIKVSSLQFRYDKKNFIQNDFMYPEMRRFFIQKRKEIGSDGFKQYYLDLENKAKHWLQGSIAKAIVIQHYLKTSQSEANQIQIQLPDDVILNYINNNIEETKDSILEATNEEQLYTILLVCSRGGIEDKSLKHGSDKIICPV